MTESSSTPNTHAAENTDFGTNDWLVEEMYERYQADPNSVDPAWRTHFEYHTPHLASATPASTPAAAATSAPSVPTPASVETQPASEAQSLVSPVSTAEPRPSTIPPAPADLRSVPTAVPERHSQLPADPRPYVAPLPPVTGSVVLAQEPERLRGPAARVVTNMELSLSVPTATSLRSVPAKMLIDNRIVINGHLARSRGGKVSFTHLIAYALVQALGAMPEMNWAYAEADGKPGVLKHTQVNLGLAIDMTKPDGSRQLLVPNIKNAQAMDFAEFWAAYEDLIRRARHNQLTVEDFQGTTISLTNPGTLGTVSSVPRLMPSQGTILGVGAMDYPAEWQGAAVETIARNAVSKAVSLTSTYDHRIIQGAQSGEFLRKIHALLLGEDDFYDKVYIALRIPYEPVRWAKDIRADHDDDLNKTARVQELIHAYRVRGHLIANTDPLGYEMRKHPDLDVQQHGLTLWDLEREFATGGFGGEALMQLRSILGVLRDSYCRTVGIEYMHIQDPDERQWLQQKLEQPHSKPAREEQLRILSKLNAAEVFETFLQTKYIGQKRFSLEGGESTIPCLDEILTQAAQSSMLEVCIGMPHRGRLNVLANIAGKSYAQIFREFEGSIIEGSAQGSGDVKYHLGTSGTYQTENGESCKVYLAANPSHLEAVNPVLQGIVRAKQDQLPLEQAYDVLPILLHGDAAFAGQGIVAETLNLSQLRGYRIGGTIHIVINNQIGFTTSPTAGRSSLYSTDVGKMVQAPIFHVNGDDPEAVVRVARIAFEYRQRFHKDVIIDLVCYRKRGHNESDDPSLTQPLMYKLIENKRTVRELYREALVGRGDISPEDAEIMQKDFNERLEQALAWARAEEDPHEEDFSGPSTREVQLTGQKKLLPQQPTGEVQTAITRSVVDAVVNSQLTMPEGFKPSERLKLILQRRADMVENDNIDWGMGEALAIGSLLSEGRMVRLAGQDSRRGTFGHRHAVIVDKDTGWRYKPLKRMYSGGAKFAVYDSFLSEYAALGFEYGYSVARPDALVMWEAQFGDFANGAQTIIDEFISSGEQKWGQYSQVVMLLPHGYEGQGPDHSSARIERYLQLCAEDNLTVAIPSTPASYFHLLRWQARSRLSRPLICFTPKSLLRLKTATSKLTDFTQGEFRAVLPDEHVDPSAVKRILLCSGRVYYDLLAERTKRNLTDVAIVRVERPYPLPTTSLPQELARYSNQAELRWVQEEPANMGAWSFMALSLPEMLNRPLVRVSRPASSSPAVGQHQRHEIEQRALIDEAFS